MLRPFGYIVTEHNAEAVAAAQHRATFEQQLQINLYWHAYRKAHGFAPEGLHWLPKLGVFVLLHPSNTAPEVAFDQAMTASD